MFEKSLTDLVKGIRANKSNESQFISTCLAEIRQEVASTDIKKKAVAVQKLIYVRSSRKWSSSFTHPFFHKYIACEK